SKFDVDDPYEYGAGLNNYHESESIPGTNPIGCIQPQRVKGTLYHDRLTGSSFTINRKDNKQVHIYRTLPCVSMNDYKEWQPESGKLDLGLARLNFTPSAYNWPAASVDKEATFLTGLKLLAGVGHPALKKGMAYYLFAVGKDMPDNQVFISSDGDLLIAPQRGSIDVKTELGPLRVRASEFAVIPRGIRFHVSLVGGPANGWVVETFMNHFELPELGILGSSGLASPRDFLVPRLQPYTPGPDTQIINKYCGNLFSTTYKGTIFNIIAWHGTYFPYKYDMGRFNAMGSISYDHADPSIFTRVTLCPGTFDSFFGGILSRLLESLAPKMPSPTLATPSAPIA
ncbi:RmlC-like cupin, partial [Zopfia rhizophila CBS 207.26]